MGRRTQKKELAICKPWGNGVAGSLLRPVTEYWKIF